MSSVAGSALCGSGSAAPAAGGTCELSVSLSSRQDVRGAQSETGVFIDLVE